MPTTHAPKLEMLRAQYAALAQVFNSNNLPLNLFADRLKGETDMGRIREGVSAMRDYLIYRGFMENDPQVAAIPDDNRPEHDLALRDSVESYLTLTPVRAAASPVVHGVGTTPVADKFYMVGDTPMQAVMGRNGHLYARRRSSDGKWEYVKGAIYAIRAHGRPATVSDIARHGLASGQCFVCGKRLRDPKSVKAGIGPKCAKLVRG